VPRLDGALQAISLGAIPGGLLSNRDYAECMISEERAGGIPADVRTLMFDPQTSGGLLIGVGEADAEGLLAAMIAAGIPAARIARVLAGKPAIVLR
jgi:selenide,water dikinase